MAAGRARARRRQWRTSAGQATVELALLLPVVMMLFLAVLQVGVVAKDQVLVAGAAREAARAVAVDGRLGAALQAARRSGPLDPAGLRVEVSRRGAVGSTIRVVVRYRAITDAPLIGPLVGDVDLRAEASMRVEQ